MAKKAKSVSGLKTKATRISLDLYLDLFIKHRPNETMYIKWMVMDIMDKDHGYERRQSSMAQHNMLRRIDSAYLVRYPNTPINDLRRGIGMLRGKEYIVLIKEAIALDSDLCDDQPLPK